VEVGCDRLLKNAEALARADPDGEDQGPADHSDPEATLSRPGGCFEAYKPLSNARISTARQPARSSTSEAVDVGKQKMGQSRCPGDARGGAESVSSIKNVSLAALNDPPWP
jgi:hypothetical protein